VQDVQFAEPSLEDLFFGLSRNGAPASASASAGVAP
jgi:hypothetical protein